jgi:hypothetical protein
MYKQLKDYTETELKATAYDQLVVLEQAQTNIKVINQELASRAQNTQTKTNMDENKIETSTTESEVVAEEVMETTVEDTTEVTGEEIA